jgi:hypothetical protein
MGQVHPLKMNLAGPQNKIWVHGNKPMPVGFEVLTAGSMKVAVFWVERRVVR